MKTYRLVPVALVLTLLALGLGPAPAGAATLPNYKPAIVNGAEVKDSNDTTITTDSATYRGADRYKVFVVFHHLVSGRLTVRKQ